jgi:hypothetical protein
MKANMALATITVIALTGLAGCASAPSPYALTYHQALQSQAAGTAAPADASIKAFVALYSDLQGPELAQRITAVYAPDAYFNDTVHTLTRRQDIIDYLEQTAQRADSIQVRIDDIASVGADTYVRWTMRTGFSVAGSDKDIVTIGMTHLRFDDQGRVILHQDFWDSTEGLYRHLPVVGGLINWVGKKL